MKYYFPLIASMCSLIITTVGYKHAEQNKILVSENALHSLAVPCWNDQDIS
jgi:hypothetical protein